MVGWIALPCSSRHSCECRVPALRESWRRICGCSVSGLALCSASLQGDPVRPGLRQGHGVAPLARGRIGLAGREGGRRGGPLRGGAAGRRWGCSPSGLLGASVGHGVGTCTRPWAARTHSKVRAAVHQLTKPHWAKPWPHAQKSPSGARPCASRPGGSGAVGVGVCLTLACVCCLAPTGVEDRHR